MEYFFDPKQKTKYIKKNKAALLDLLSKHFKVSETRWDGYDKISFLNVEGTEITITFNFNLNASFKFMWVFRSLDSPNSVVISLNELKFDKESVEKALITKIKFAIHEANKYTEEHYRRLRVRKIFKNKLAELVEKHTYLRELPEWKISYHMGSDYTDGGYVELKFATSWRGNTRAQNQGSLDYNSQLSCSMELQYDVNTKNFSVKQIHMHPHVRTCSEYPLSETMPLIIEDLNNAQKEINLILTHFNIPL